VKKRTATLIAASFGALLILVAYAVLLRSILHERSEQEELQGRTGPLETAVAAAQAGLDLLPARQTELAELEAELHQAQLAFPSEVDSTEVLAHVVATAAVNRVNLRQVRAQEPVTVTVGRASYRILPYEVEVEGELEAIAAFLVDLETGPISTLTLDEITVQAQPTPTPTPAPTGSAATTPSPDPFLAEEPILYRVSLLVRVFVRLVEPGTTEPGPAGTQVSPEERIAELHDLLDEARSEEDWDRAISILIVLRQIDPSDNTIDQQLLEAYLLDGARRLAAGQYEQAAEDYRAALAVDPDNADAIAALQSMNALTPSPTPRPTRSPTPTPSEPWATRSAMPFTCQYQLQMPPYPNWTGVAGRVQNLTGEPLPGYYIVVECCPGCGHTTVQAGADPTVNSIYGSEAAWELACDATKHAPLSIQVRLHDLVPDADGQYPPVSEQLAISTGGSAPTSMGFVICTQNWDDWH
jgi:Tfp pilus assembly protein PilO